MLLCGQVRSDEHRRSKQQQSQQSTSQICTTLQGSLARPEETRDTGTVGASSSALPVLAEGTVNNLSWQVDDVDAAGPHWVTDELAGDPSWRSNAIAIESSRGTVQAPTFTQLDQEVRTTKCCSLSVVQTFVR